MIGIQLQGEAVPLDTEVTTEVELNLENPLLGDAERLSPGSVSMPFKLPGGEASPNNARQLNNPDVIANTQGYVRRAATLSVHGQPYKTGQLKARANDARKNIDANFLFGLNAISAEFKSAKLRDVLSENIVIDAADRLRAIYVKYTGSGDVTLTVNGKSYTGADLLTVTGLINADADASLDSGKYVPKAQYFTSGTTPTGLAQPFTKVWLSQYYTFYDEITELTFLLWQDSVDPLQELSVSVPSESIADYLFDSWDMADYYAAYATFLSGYISGTYPTDKIRFPTFFNANLHNGELLKASEIINAVDAGGMVRNWPSAARGANSIQPFLRLKWVLEKIATRFGFVLDGDFYNHAKVADMLLDNSVTLDLPQEYINNRKFLFWRRSFNLNELVPDISVVDFLKRICARYNVGMYYNEQTLKVTMTLREPLALAIGYEAIDGIASRVEGSEDLRITGYTVRVPKEETDALSLEETVTVGISEKEVPIECGRLFTTNGQVSGGFTVGPRVSRPNNAKFGLRIFHYKGIINNGVNNYPAADINATDFYEGLADVGSTKGLHSRFHKYWLLFEMNRQEVKLSINWPLRLLLNFNWGQKRRYNGSNFLVKSFKVKINNRRVSVSDVGLLTMQ